MQTECYNTDYCMALQLGYKEWSKTSLFKRERDNGTKMAQAISQETP
jgi:hypothetical protein